MIQSIKYVTYLVSDINKSIAFNKGILKVEILIVDDKIVKINTN